MAWVTSRGIASRLDHLKWLGVDALWMSPIYPSPMADFGYDVSDFENVDPVFGSLADYDDLVAAAGDRGLALLMDLVPCHTSIEHPWFAEHPDWYVWTDRPNNWRSAFGGSAWERLGDRFYLHSFYREQPDLSWRNPEVVRAMQGVLRFWLERGADGYRVDALDRLDEGPADARRPAGHGTFGLPQPESWPTSAPVHSRNAPDIGTALAAIRQAAGDALLVGEVYLPAANWGPYLSTWTARSRSSSCTRHGRRTHCARRSPAAPRARTARPGRCRTTTSAGSTRASGRRTRAPRPFCCSPCPGWRSCTRGTRSGSAKGPEWHALDRAATGTATPCSGTARPRAASPTASRGSRPSTRRAHERGGLSATTRPPC